MRYGVVIVTFNRLSLLKECISCILNQTRKFDEVIIVDNCSTDGTKEYLEDYISNNENGVIKFYSLEKNIGGSGGFNFALSQVSNDIDWVLIIDDDAMLENNYIEEIEKHILKNYYYAYSGAVLTDDKIDTTHRRLITNNILLRQEDVRIEEYEKDTFEYHLSTFCGLLIKRELINTIGLPNKDYFIWYDDTEYSLRINQFSRILNVNNAKLNHKTVKNSQTISWKSYYGVRNSIHMGKLYSSNKIIFSILTYIYCMLVIIKNIMRVLLNKRREYGLVCIKIYTDALHDSFKGKLGINENYLPGKKI